MKKQKKGKYANVSTLRKTLVIGGLFTSILGGSFLGIVAIYECKNAVYPYASGIYFGALGLIVGFFLAGLIKPYVILNKTMLSEYFIFRIFLSAGFIGGFMLLGHTINSSFSQTRCDEFAVVDIHHTERDLKMKIRRLRLGNDEGFILYVNIDGQTKPFFCRRKYYEETAIGEKVRVCIYDSPIGLDNLVLTDDH